jgi:hypothetical protein
LQSLDKAYQQEERPTGSRLEAFYRRRQAAVVGLLACSGSKSCCQSIKNLPLAGNNNAMVLTTDDIT